MARVRDRIFRHALADTPTAIVLGAAHRLIAGVTDAVAFVDIGGRLASQMAHRPQRAAGVFLLGGTAPLSTHAVGRRLARASGNDRDKEEHGSPASHGRSPALVRAVRNVYAQGRLGHRSKSSVRCPRCRLQLERCMCTLIPQLDLTTRIVLVMHRREILTTTASGPLALAALPNSELFLHGVKDAPVDLNFLHDGTRRILILYPSEDARPLSAELLAEDPRPVTLIVPDGSWRQASRAARRIPGVEFAERVTLPPDRPTEWGLRRETKAFGLATFEAIARALGILEGPAVRETLEAIFHESVRRQKALRPFPPSHEAPAEDAPRSAPSPPEVVDARGPDADADEHVDAGIDRTPLSILHQDDWLVCVNKPSGHLVHRGWGDDGPVTLQTLREQLGRPVYPVHRLDRQTSGALLLAFYPEVARDLQRAFESGGVVKRYLALCRGADPNLTCIDHPLSREPGHGEKKEARTDLHLLGAHGRYGLYEVFPRTGRTHQVRRHLKHASHPIIGDVRYGKGEHNRLFRQEFDFHRLALHCASLRLTHPRTGAALVFEAPLAADFERLLVRLDLSAR